MEECWKDIDGYEGIYQISNLGVVRGLDRLRYNKGKNCYHNVKGKIIKTTKREYEHISLSKNGETKTFFVHRLVAKAFVKNPNNYNVINHKDGNPLNNNANNLEWCTQKYNCNYGEHNMLQSLARRKKVFQLDLNNNIIKEWESVKRAKEETKITHISACARGERKSAGGYIWKYEKQ